jgi:tetratricopeptide (TPR) repeat protein
MFREIGTRRPGRALARRILIPVARLITWFRLEPDNALIAGVVKLLGAPGARELQAVVPTFSEFVLSSSTANSDSEGHTQIPSVPDQRALTVAAMAAAAGNTARIITVLEAHVDRHAAIVGPQVFERLAEAYLSANSPAPAVETLRRGLGTHAENGRLHRALALALSAMSEWAEAVTHWEQTPKDLQETASIWTVIGVTRAYRCSGNALRADELAKRAARSYPDNELLREEIRLCRPHIMDWSRCLVAADPTERSQQAGEVTSMGFLHGGSEALTGWVDAPDEVHPEVHLLVNNRTIAATVAADILNVSTAKAFSINCAELLQFLGDGDILQVASNGKAVSLPGLGGAAMVACGQASQYDCLQARLDEGYVFTKDGRLRPGHDADSKRAVLDLFEEVSSVIVTGTGQPVFPFYGNLLGAVREGDLIAHDVDGFDILYLCSSNQPGEVKVEVARVCHLLIERGYDLSIEPWSIMIRKKQSDTMFVDMSYGWFTTFDELHISFGWRFEPAQGRVRFVAGRHCYLADREVPIPGNAEEVLQPLYGPGWLVPDQGFASRKKLIRDEEFLLKTSEIRAITTSS